ncbi:hypothetical protein WJX81_002762 [Elliptochloris bilobata]|uniref:Methylthioribose-1-phosphate isomerase n=1 Tax=Elliptochloris bilobata TaxID=381761 RepID=A0AAW1RAK3_9CHLO
MTALEAIRWRQGPPASLQLLDQRLLPLQTVYINVGGPSESWHAIKDMAIRGAPAIAIAAALALAAELVNGGGGTQFSSPSAVQEHVKKQMAYLVTSRPTAVNLSIAEQQLTALAAKAASAPGATAASVTEAVVGACHAMLQADVAGNKAMGDFGAKAILAELTARGRSSKAPVRALTHCNTGSLATAAYGTALGVVRALAQRGALEHVFCTETRPYNQGSRLTAYELVHDGLPATLVADSAAGALLAAGRVDAVVTGADRVAANGDTANKIGTLSLAVNAQRCGVPFYIAAPTQTLDPNMADGSHIPIEERSPSELTHDIDGRQVAAPGIQVWNPGFDVTPAELIQGIITEKGVIERLQDGTFDVRGFMASHGLLPPQSGSAQVPCSTIPGFRALDAEGVRGYLAADPELARRIGPSRSEADWQVREVGDGNINYVYIVKGPAGGLVVKQGLPYIRIARDWALTQERARFEAEALQEQARHAPVHVPAVHRFDAQLALIVMEYLPPPHSIVRGQLTAGALLPRLPAHVAEFMAATLFGTSLFALDTIRWRQQQARFQNGELCRLTEQVIFSDPYRAARVNRHTTPQLDAEAAALRADPQAKAAAAALKAKFCELQQALLHGDLHTGSIMATQETTYMIDAEFACVGPIAFDVGKMVGNLLLAFFASDGLASAAEPRHRQRRWLLQATEEMYSNFTNTFVSRWTTAVQSSTAGDLCPADIFGPEAAGGAEALQVAQATFLLELLPDVLAFAGAVMIRRIVGIAHVADLDTISDPDIRAVCERRALRCARELLVNPQRFADMRAVAAHADAARTDGAQPHFALQTES